ncbi:hypothetical protein [Bacillus solitudinis]|uniref:hypothetical protein n=1 Tax=Bacillus solitudinis TaxID=2014074 RepID=UPI000C23D948|nr:hypothetical protein [Bacillus solitudinis]
MIKLKEPVVHDGASYEAGELIEKIEKNQAQRLVGLGVAFFVAENNSPPSKEGLELSFEGIELEELKEAAKDAEVTFNAQIGLEKLIERIKEEGKVETVLSQFDNGEE